MIIGVTGGFCTGKSKVTKIFESFGAKIIDLDRLSHKALKRGEKSFHRIIKEFGKDILVNNAISRTRLAKKVFGNKKKLAKLNSIVHPVIIKGMKSLISESKKSYKVIVVEAPLLFEASLKSCFDYIAVVKTNQDTQIKRAIKKTDLSRIDILKRINSQLTLKEKVKKADFVVDNNGSVDNTYKQVKEIWQTLKEVK